MKKSRLLGAVSPFALTFVNSSFATMITLPEYSGEIHNIGSDFPISSVTVGTFNVSFGITLATISGTFGNSISTSSAGVDLFLDGILIEQCIKDDPCFFQGLNPWK